MCGFAVMATFGGGRADALAVERMAAVIRHRGPDAEGTYVSGAVGFGFRRLSILDLSPAGHQPMRTDDGQQIVVFNGEIYNYVELREELKALGHAFRSTGDTEVLLHAYLQWGRDCLTRLNGMWAFVIYDARRGTLFGSRDRFGVKPLYRYRRGDSLFLASEIKAILASGRYEGGTNWAVASRFLQRGLLDVDCQTFYSGIEQVPPGAAFEVDLQGRTSEWRFWSLGELAGAPANGKPAAPEGQKAEKGEEADAPRVFAALFEDAVRLRMRSDVSVGVCLSGGIDSSSIISVMSRLRGADGRDISGSLEAFSYISPDFDESAYIADTIAQTGAHLNRLAIEPRALWDSLERILWFHDEPVHSPTALIGFGLMKLASDAGVKVVLNGQGADETIAGYHSYFRDYWDDLLAAGQIAAAWREIQAYSQASGSNPRRLFQEALGRVARTKVKRWPRGASLVRRWRARQPEEAFSWFAPDLPVSGARDGWSVVDSTLRGALRRSVEWRPLPIYLRVEDRNSMAHSVEARLPFMDYRLVSLAFRLPAHWKLRGPWNKYVLREAMRDRIPESVRMRVDKMGFPTSSRQWFAGPWHEAMHDLLSSRALVERGIYDVAAIRRDLERHRRGAIDVSDRLFRVAQFEAWSRIRQDEAQVALAHDSRLLLAHPVAVTEGCEA